jgi:hypothetical protein
MRTMGSRLAWRSARFRSSRETEAPLCMESELIEQEDAPRST